MENVLVTGGSGSFGHGFAKYAKELSPKIKKIVVFSRDEMKHLAMASMPETKDLVQFVIGDVRDRPRIDEILKLHRIDTVIHAAALKIVPSAELHPNEYIKTNVTGSQNVLEACLYSDFVEAAIAVSTDKAVCPINLYGATKLIMEKEFVARSITPNKRIGVVRYGNVIGSNASVVPFFRKLIESGATSLPITDSRMTRFWISLRSAVELVVKSIERMQGGEIFVPLLPSMKVSDIALALAPDLPHHIVGIRAGEKLHECMVPAEVGSHLIEFQDHMTICPMFAEPLDYLTNRIGDVGRFASSDFDGYSSDRNSLWIRLDEFHNFISGY